MMKGKEKIPIRWTKGNIGQYCELVRGVSYERDEVGESISDSSYLIKIDLPEKSIVKNFHNVVGVYYKEMSSLFLQNNNLDILKI